MICNIIFAAVDWFFFKKNFIIKNLQIKVSHTKISWVQIRNLSKTSLQTIDECQF